MPCFDGKLMVQSEGKSKIDEFFQCHNEEETVGEFVAHIIEAKCELKGFNL